MNINDLIIHIIPYTESQDENKCPFEINFICPKCKGKGIIGALIDPYSTGYIWPYYKDGGLCLSCNAKYKMIGYNPETKMVAIETCKGV